MKALSASEETLVNGGTGTVETRTVETLFGDDTHKVYHDLCPNAYAWGKNFKESSCTFPKNLLGQAKARHDRGEKIADIMNSLGVPCPRAV